MGFWSNIFKRNNSEKGTGSVLLDYYLRGKNANGSVAVNKDSVLGLTSYWRGVNILADTVAGLPKSLINKEGDTRKRVENHPSIDLLTYKANDALSSYSWHALMIVSASLTGDGYSIILRDANYNPKKLIPIDKSLVEVRVFEDGNYVYRVKIGNDYQLVLPENMFHIKWTSTNGYTGKNPIEVHRTTHSISLNADEYSEEFYSKGMSQDGYVEVEGKFDEAMQERIRKSWDKTYSGLGKSKVAFLDNGMKFVQLQMKPQDAQYLGTRQFQKGESATILGIPPPMLGIMDKATYNNMEQMATQFVNYGLMPWIHRFEDEARLKLLTVKQAKSYRWKYNVNALLRGDTEARSEYYSKMVEHGVYSPNDIRAFEDENPYEGGDRYSVPLNTIPTDLIDKKYENEKGSE